MASTGTRAIIDAVARRLDAEPQIVLPTLRLLIDPDAVADPHSPDTGELARRASANRLIARRAEFRANALDTGSVRQLLGGVSRQAVAQRVAHRQLLAAEIGRRLYFPDWQFGADGPRPRLPELIAVLTDDGRSPVAADALMRHPLDEENGRSAADLFAAGKFELALHYVTAGGGGF